MATKPKFFRVATEGATSDGRKIERAQIEQMAATYNADTKAARVNVEHVRGVAPDSPFGAYGDILSLKTGEVQLQVGDKTETRLALYAEIQPLPNLVALTKAGQKLYTSIEITPNFAATGKAYLAGVAVTDNPASLGTEMLQFCAGKGAASPLAARKQSPDNWFTEAEPVEMDFSDAGEVTPTDGSSLLGFLKSLLGFSAQDAAALAAASTPGASTPAAAPAPAAPAPVVPAHSFASIMRDPVFAASAQAMLKFAEESTATLATLTKRQDKADAAFTALQAKLQGTPSNTFSHRPGATGADNVERADC